MQVTLYLVTIFILGALCEDKYTSKYDNVDIESIMKNDRLLKNYIDCLVDKGKCSNDAAELKKHIPEALQTGCAKCSEKQRQGIRRVVKYLSESKKDSWNELVRKYDPEGVYKAKFAELIKKEGI